MQPMQAVIVRANWQTRILRVLFRALFVCLFRARVMGLEHVPRAPYIACMNHLGWAEAFMVMLWFPTAPLLHGLGERDVMTRSAFRRWFFRQVPIFLPLDRDAPRAAIRSMQDVLARGGALLIAPEGKLGEREGALNPLQNGAAFLAVRANVPLVPIGATGTRELWLRKTLTLRVGVPLSPDAFTGETRAREHAMTEQLAQAMRALLPGDTQSPRYKPLRDFLTKLL